MNSTGPHKRWSMWFNSMQREEPYLALIETFQRWIGAFGNLDTGAAWLSSARVVRCWVKSRNERNPFPYLPAFRMGTLRILPVTNWRKAGRRQVIMALRPGLAHVLQWSVQRGCYSDVMLISKSRS